MMRAPPVHCGVHGHVPRISPGDETRNVAPSSNRTPASSSEGDLGQQFEEEFARHLAKENERRKLQFGAIGAGLAGAVSVVASPMLIPGLAVATLAGGAGGYQYGRKQAEDSVRRHGSMASGSTATATQQRPTLRRLRYLVEWGHWQLHEYRAASPGRRADVLSEVVRAFSPWVQRIYFLAANGGTCSQRVCRETRETLRHVAPLYQWLQRRTTFNAVLEAVDAVGVASLLGSIGVVHLERCRVVFPTVFETIVFVERSDRSLQGGRQQPATSASNYGMHGRIDPARCNGPRRKRRLQRLATTISNMLERPDVADALRNQPTSPTAMSAGSDALAGDLDDLQHASSLRAKASSLWKSSHGSNCVEQDLVVPPEGVENEAEAAGFGSDGDSEQYYSCSDESDDDDMHQRTRQNDGSSNRAIPDGVAVASDLRRGSHSGFSQCAVPASGVVGGSRLGCFLQRTEALPRGVSSHTWRALNTSGFELRAGTYLENRRKEPAGQSMLEILHVDIFRIGQAGPVPSVARHPDHGPQAVRRNGDNRFLLIQNWIFAPYQCVIVAAVDPGAPWLRAGTDGGPQARLWHRFLRMPLAEMREVFKVIINVEQGPWIVKRAVQKKPVLPGRTLNMTVHHEHDDHLELVFDLASGRAAQVAARLVIKALKNLHLGMLFLIEARHKDELPERPLMCLGVQNIDTAAFLCPP